MALQNRLDGLSDKARKKNTSLFTDDDKKFLRTFYWSLAFGGWCIGYKEASEGMFQYLNSNVTKLNNEGLLEIDPYIYKTNPIMLVAVSEMKQIIISDIKSIGSIRNNGEFSSAGSIKSNDLGVAQGNIDDNGIIKFGEKYRRLQHFDLHVELKNKSLILATVPSFRINSTWYIQDNYDFTPFPDEKVTQFPFHTKDPSKVNSSDGDWFSVKDGLSAFLADLGLAKIYKYRVQWVEIWGFK